MPKICNMRILVDGKLQEVPILYGVKHQFHSLGVESLIGNSEFRFSAHETQRQLEDAIKAAVKQYHENKSITRKVIAYMLYLSTDLRMNPDERRGCFSGYQSWVPDAMRRGSGSNFQEGVKSGRGFSIKWEVLLEVKGNKLKYFEVREDGMRGGERYPSYDLIIDWTEQREQGFREIDKAIEKLVQQIGKVIGEPETMSALLDSVKFNLLPAPAATALAGNGQEVAG